MLQDIWKNDKHFVVALGILAVSAGFLLIAVLPTFSETADAEKKTDSTRKFIEESLGSPDWQTAADVRAIDAEIATLQESYQRLKSQLLWQPDKRFSATPTDSSPLIYFSRRHEEVSNSIVRAAARHNIDIPKTLNFRQEEITTDSVPVLLRRISVVERLANIAIEAGVQSITQFLHGRDIDETTAAHEGQGAFIRGSFMVIEVQCHFNAFAALIHGTQQKGSLLQLYKVAIEKPQAETDLMKVSVTVRAVDVDDKAVVQTTESKPEEESGGSRWQQGR
jgi:hypothetical protein